MQCFVDHARTTLHGILFQYFLFNVSSEVYLRVNHEQEPTLTVTSLILCRSYILEVFIG